jgi:hypothetical protein
MRLDEKRSDHFTDSKPEANRDALQGQMPVQPKSRRWRRGDGRMGAGPRTGVVMISPICEKVAGTSVH